MALGAVVVGLLAGAVPSAEAEVGVDIYVHNETKYPIKLGPAGDHYCWYNYQLDLDAASAVPPNGVTRAYTAAKETPGCIFEPKSFRGLGVFFRQPGNRFQDALTVSTRMSANGPALPVSKNYPQWQVQVGGGTLLVGNPQGWLPVNALQRGSGTAGGGGMFCLSVQGHGTDVHSFDVIVREGRGCRSREVVSGFTPPSDASEVSTSASRAGAARTGGAPGDGDRGVVVDVLQLGQAACDLLKIDPPWPSGCQDISNSKKWNLANVTAKVTNVKPDNPVSPTFGKKLVDTQVHDNHNDAADTISFKEDVTVGESKTTTTTRGYQVGEKVTWAGGFELPVIGGKLNLEISATQNWGSTEQQTNNKQKTVTDTVTANAAPHKRTYLYVYQGKGDLTANFSADLTLGTAGSAESLLTPLPRALGMSPAIVHPCVGYLIGDGDPNSLIGLGKAAVQQFDPSDPTLSNTQRLFLQAVTDGSFSVSDKPADRCPAWPQGYPAAGAFTGRGTIVANDLGGFPGASASAKGSASDADAQPWTIGVQSIYSCTYNGPIPTDGQPEQQPSQPEQQPSQPANSSPCSSSAMASGATPGTVIDGATDPSAQQLVGNHQSNLLLADDHPDVDVLTAQGGTFDILDGSRHAEMLDGGPGEDFLTAEGGPDRLDGGLGDDTLEGGADDDRLVDTDGHNRVAGGSGDDKIRSAAGAEGGLFGEQGDDELTMQGRGPVMLLGGAGDDAYRLFDGASARRVAELPGEGVDTIQARASATLPPNVERVVARTSAGVRLRAYAGDQDLIGGPGADRLDGGLGADRQHGRGGDDELRLSRYGFDHARGGRGADRFVPVTRPARMPRWSHLDPARARSAHVIEDLDASECDRLVLSTKSYGAALARLRANMKVTYAPQPRGRSPQLLFTRRDHLLRFDSDGRGARPAQVIAILRGHARVPARAIEIVVARRDGGR